MSLVIANDILVEITVRLNYEKKLAEAIAELGRPNYIGYRDLGAEKIICEINLIWIDKRLILSSEKFEDNIAIDKCKTVHDTGSIQSDLLISEARYVSVYAIDWLLSSGKDNFFEFSELLSEK